MGLKKDNVITGKHTFWDVDTRFNCIYFSYNCKNRTCECINARITLTFMT